jgi:hypothetical protein
MEDMIADEAMAGYHLARRLYQAHRPRVPQGPVWVGDSGRVQAGHHGAFVCSYHPRVPVFFYQPVIFWLVAAEVPEGGKNNSRPIQNLIE